MKCFKHEAEMQEVCDDFVCSSCSEEYILSEPLPRKPKGAEFELVYEPSVHREILKKKKHVST